MIRNLPLLLTVAKTLLLTGCSESAKVDDTATEETSTYDDSAQAVEEAPTDEATASYSGEEFHGNPCIGDCSGHEAGYQWAEENSITDPDTCGGNSNSFIEGCQSYAEEQQ